MAEIGGVLTAMVTPFAEDGSVDEAAARKLARHLVENGSHGVVVAGTTGESPTLSDEEDVVAAQRRQGRGRRRATVICGTGTNDTRHSEHLSAAAAEAGADAVLVGDAVLQQAQPGRDPGALRGGRRRRPAIPVIAYNIPSRVVINVAARPARRAGRDRERGRRQAGQQRRDRQGRGPRRAGRQRRRLPALPGDRGQSAASSSPRTWSATRCARSTTPPRPGTSSRAREIDASIRPVYEAIGVDTNPIPVKAAAEMLGLIPSARMRLPMVEADERRRAPRYARRSRPRAC